MDTDAAPLPQNKKNVIYADGTTLYVSPELARRLACEMLNAAQQMAPAVEDAALTGLVAHGL